MLSDIAANFFAGRVGTTDFADVRREKKDFEVVLLVNGDGAAVFFGLGGKDERAVRAGAHLTELLLD